MRTGASARAHSCNKTTHVTSFPHLAWDPSLSSGIPQIDAQHRRLFEVFNAAARARAEGVDAARADALIDELIAYAQEHFREESELMARWPIDPGRKTMHLRAHARFSAFLAEARDLAAEQPGDAVLDLLAFLAQWLLHHVAGVDTQLAREVRALEAGASARDGAEAAFDAMQARLSDTVSELTDALLQRSFELARQRQSLASLQELYRALLHSGDVLIQSRSEQEMLDSLCSKMVQDTPFHAAWIGHPGEHGELFDVLSLFGEGTAQVLASRPRLTPEYRVSMTVRAWTEQRLLYSNDTLADPMLEYWHEGLAANRWLSALAVPIHRGGSIWAVLTLASPRRGTFDEATVDVCSRIAALLGHGLDELDLKARIQSMQRAESWLARTDALTGLPNRLALDEYLPRAIERARRNGRVLGVGLIDMDDFKSINDRFGHDAGDAVLREFARRMRDCVRRAEFLARLGGDEFVVVFDDLDPDEALDQACKGLERLHGTVEAPFPLPDDAELVMGIALGLALYPDQGVTEVELLRRADAAMYRAKHREQRDAPWWCLATDAD